MANTSKSAPVRLSSTTPQNQPAIKTGTAVKSITGLTFPTGIKPVSVHKQSYFVNDFNQPLYDVLLSDGTIILASEDMINT